MQGFGSMLKDYLEYYKISQTDFAERLGISTKHIKEDVDTLLDHLSRYPAINFDKDLQAFDTRLLMFCLQKAIESNLAITSYAQAVTLANTPLESVE